MSEDSNQRLHKVLAHAGVASRRAAEDLILQGRVQVNGRVVTELGTKVDPKRDQIRVDGQRIQVSAQAIYVVLNKPKGVLSTMEDSRGRKSLGDLVSVPERLYPVGRLDANSQGLILLTDDGDLAHLLTHPRYEHEKEYRVLVNGVPSEKTLEAWRRGVLLDDKPTAPAQIEILSKDRHGAYLRVTMREGRKRQIRRVAALLGHPVRELTRVRLGPLKLDALEVGQWRYLTPKEVRELQSVKERARRARSQRRKRPGPKR